VNDLCGVDLATLQLWLSQAQAAFGAYMSTGRLQSVSYTQGDGGRSVSYSTPPDISQLNAWISRLQREISLRTGVPLCSRRRAIGIRF
jgi:hypothetical protein